jgi:hypothetical protein
MPFWACFALLTLQGHARQCERNTEITSPTTYFPDDVIPSASRLDPHPPSRFRWTFVGSPLWHARFAQMAIPRKPSGASPRSCAPPLCFSLIERFSPGAMLREMAAPRDAMALIKRRLNLALLKRRLDLTPLGESRPLPDHPAHAARSTRQGPGGSAHRNEKSSIQKHHSRKDKHPLKKCEARRVVRAIVLSSNLDTSHSFESSSP